MIKSKSELKGGQIDGGVRNEEQNENEKRKKHASAHGRARARKKTFKVGRLVIFPPRARSQGPKKFQ